MIEGRARSALLALAVAVAGLAILAAVLGLMTWLAG